MKIKRYLDKDMRNVLKRVREDQGPDAVILSNRRVEEGIEVIAAIDYDEALVRHAVGARSEDKAVINSDALAKIAEDDVAPTPMPAADKGEPSVVASSLAPAANEPDDKAAALDIEKHQVLDGLRDEISSLKGMLETRLSDLAWQTTTERDPMRAQVLRNLARLGVAPDTASMLLNRLGPIEDVRRLWQEPLMELARMIPVADNSLLEHGGTFALIGPTGVGKTTTIAKLAARFAMQHGADQIALVSADAYRVGAREHLAAFANIIGAKVFPASNANELQDILAGLDRYKLVLIDTEGRSQRDRDLATRLAAWGDHQSRVRYYLTLSAATQESALDEIVTSFRDVPLEGAVVTKIDEAGQLGCVLSALIRHDLPAAWLSDGQRIPEDLHSATKKKMWLANQAVECFENSQPRLNEAVLADLYNRTSVANG